MFVGIYMEFGDQVRYFLTCMEFSDEIRYLLTDMEF